jgi:hypothetical protein
MGRSPARRRGNRATKGAPREPPRHGMDYNTGPPRTSIFLRLSTVQRMLPLPSLQPTWPLLLLIACVAQARGDDAPQPLSLKIEGPVDAELAPIAGQLATLYYECYPELLRRFEHPERKANRNVRLVFKSDLEVPGYASGDAVVVSIDWLKKHPRDLGLFTHELTHLVQAYPNPDPGWLTEGIADYARHRYGPAKQTGWSLPETLAPGQSYRDSYGVTAKFLVWLEEKHPGTIDKLHRKMQDGTFEVDAFQQFTGHDLETLWRRCVGDLKK